MTGSVGEEKSSALCTLHFFDCTSSKDESASRRFSLYPGVKREMNVQYQQPHLIEPMKLRVYEDLPPTPNTPEPSQLTQWSRSIASRASSSASKINVKRRATLKALISRPRPVKETQEELPSRRRREFTPLELSIYDDSKRLSALPEFSRFSFTSLGELKKPSKALVRTQSEGYLRRDGSPIVDLPKRTASMFEAGECAFIRPETSYSIVSTSRPPSEYDALHSHPVSWVSLPGIPASRSQKPDNCVAIMTPMQEEFSPDVMTIDVGGMMLTFPSATTSEPLAVCAGPPPTPESQAPYPIVGGKGSTISSKTSRDSVHPNTANQPHKRISQWLRYRSQSASSSSVGSFSTSASFAEHRRKRLEFYKLGQQQRHPLAPVSPPKALNFSKSFSSPQHQRTNTTSTTHTADASILSSGLEHESSHCSEDSMTTYSFADVRSRAGTIKSVTSPIGLKIIAPTDQDFMPSPPFHGEIVDEPILFVPEINGPLRSPAVGVAF